MALFHDLTTTQLKQAVQIREQIESLQEKLAALLGGSASTPAKGKRVISAATKRKMAAAQQARYAKVKDTTTKASPKKSAPATAAPKKRKVSPETKAKLAAAMKARWAARKKGAPAPNVSTK